MKPTDSVPKISIITPSFNQGQFIERTIQSVLNQNYPNLQYIVMDGGSTDQTVSILKKYDKRLKKSKSIQFIWKSETDNGQAHAINKGLKLATGEIVAYLNSDDVYLPNTLSIVSLFFQNQPKAKFMYGLGWLIDAKDRKIGVYNTLPEDYEHLFESCGINQPSCFWKRDLIKSVGYFNENLKFCMDYEYWIRVSHKNQLFMLPMHLSCTRIHKLAKTSSFTHKLHTEAINICLKFYGKVHYDWIFTWVDSEYSGNRISRNYFKHMLVNSLIYYIKINADIPSIKAIKIWTSWLKNFFIYS